MSVLCVLLTIIVGEYVSVISASVAAMSWTKYESLNVNSDDIIAPLSDYLITTKSILECSRVCSVSNTCLSVLYSDEDKLCRINDNIVFFETDAVIPDPASNLVLAYSQQTSWRLGTTTTLTTRTTITPTTREVASTTLSLQTTAATTTTREVASTTLSLQTTAATTTTREVASTTLSLQTTAATPTTREVASTTLSLQTTAATTTTKMATTTLPQQSTAAAWCTNCTDYGSDFWIYREKVLVGADEIIDWVSFATCESACLAATNFTCRSFSYFAGYTQCHLHAAIACERPIDYVAISAYNHYERKCQGM